MYYNMGISYSKKKCIDVQNDEFEEKSCNDEHIDTASDNGFKEELCDDKIIKKDILIDDQMIEFQITDYNSDDSNINQEQQTEDSNINQEQQSEVELNNYISKLKTKISEMEKNEIKFNNVSDTKTIWLKVGYKKAIQEIIDIL